MIDIRHADCRAVLPTLGEVDSVVTDPPYALTANKRGGTGEASLNLAHPAGRSRITTGGGFMGQKWDAEIPGVETWREVLRVLKPGGYALIFGGTRTFHRLAVALEDAGFEIRDTLCWLYGSGFPKAKSCLKPAWEPILLCRKPGPGVEPLNIDECRIPIVDESDARHRQSAWSDHQESRTFHGRKYKDLSDVKAPTGRWPANVVHDGSDEVLAGFAEYGERPTSVGVLKRTNSIGYGGSESGPDGQGYGDTGSAARFFYCAKASRSERGEGNSHPTVKPLSLMRWLVRLVTAPSETCLDPFAGSGTTLLACEAEGVNAIGVEREASYVEIARRRVSNAQTKAGLFATAAS